MSWYVVVNKIDRVDKISEKHKNFKANWQIFERNAQMYIATQAFL